MDKVNDVHDICSYCGARSGDLHAPDCRAPEFGSPPALSVVLDNNDPFESALIKMVQTNRAKRRDYAIDSDRAGGGVFSNFEETSLALRIEGFSSTEAALFNVLQKLARIRSLRANDRLDDPANESVLDTYLDLAVYAVITYAIAKQKLEK